MSKDGKDKAAQEPREIPIDGADEVTEGAAEAAAPAPEAEPTETAEAAEAEAAPEIKAEAAVKAAAVRRARETWYLVDDSKFGRVYPAVIGEIYSGAILTNRCPDPKYRQLTLVKETEQ